MQLKSTYIRPSDSQNHCSDIISVRRLSHSAPPTARSVHTNLPFPAIQQGIRLPLMMSIPPHNVCGCSIQYWRKAGVRVQLARSQGSTLWLGRNGFSETKSSTVGRGVAGLVGRTFQGNPCAEKVSPPGWAGFAIKARRGQWIQSQGTGVARSKRGCPTGL